MQKNQLIIPIEQIASKIFLIREVKVMLDKDLAQLYKVTTGNLNKAVKRNLKRFPEDFMFKLTKKEDDSLIFQIGRPKKGGTRFRPYAFTEQGVAMLSSALNSERAIQANIAIMRTFTKMREMLMHYAELKIKIEKMEEKYNQHFKIIFEAIKRLMIEEEKPKREIGFKAR